MVTIQHLLIWLMYTDVDSDHAKGNFVKTWYLSKKEGHLRKLLETKEDVIPSNVAVFLLERNSSDQMRTNDGFKVLKMKFFWTLGLFISQN